MLRSFNFRYFDFRMYLIGNVGYYMQVFIVLVVMYEYLWNQEYMTYY